MAFPLAVAAPAASAQLAAAAAVCQGPIISGFVYGDANGNGIKDGAETGIVGSTLELRNAGNTVVATAVTDATGAYRFTADATIGTAPTTQTVRAVFPDTRTDWTGSRGLPQFDPALGALASVTVTNTASISTTIKVESRDLAPAEVTGHVAGTVRLTGPGFGTLTASVDQPTEVFNASAFDGVADWGGTSGKDFGLLTATSTNTATLTDAPSLTAYTGTGIVSVSATADGTSRASGSGNLDASISTTASAQVTVAYGYTPCNALRAGNYTIVQTAQPGTYLDGRETAGNVTPLPNTIGTDVIPVTLATADLTGQNFGEVLPATIAGCVYADPNNNGVRDPGEAAIPGATLTLSGTDDRGQPVSLTTTSGADCTYSFTNLRPGTYTVTETQPAPWLDGKVTVGSLNGVVSTNQIAQVTLAGGANGTGYNFGELAAVGQPLGPTATPTLTPPNGPAATATASSTATATSAAASATPTASPPAGALATPTTPAGTPATTTATPLPTATVVTGGSTTVNRPLDATLPTPTPVIPELPPIWLFGTGLLALGALGFRRR